MAIVKDKEKRTIKQRFAKLRADMKDMTWKEKAGHIWEYYRYTMLVVLCVLMIVGGLLYGMIASQPELHIGGVQCNMELTIEGYDYLTKDFQQKVLGKEEGQSTLNTFWFYGTPTEESITDNYRAHSSVNAYVETKALDYMLVDMFSFAHFAGDRLFMDLREILTEEELMLLDDQDLLLYDEDVTTGKKTPTAINIVDSAFIQENSEAVECYLVFIRNTPRKETCKKFWNHIKTYGGEEKPFPVQKELLAGGAQCNVELTAEGYDYLTFQFRDNVLKNTEGRVRFSKFSLKAEDTEENRAENRITDHAVQEDIGKQKLDYMLLDKQSYTRFAGQYMDLRQILTEDELAELDAQNLLLYEEDLTTGKKTPTAINIVNTAFIQQQSDAAQCYLVFMKDTARKEICVKIWAHITNFKGEE